MTEYARTNKQEGIKLKKKRIFSVLMTAVLTLTLVIFAAPVSAQGPIDLTVNDKEPWTDGAFTFENIIPGGVPMEFDFKLHNVGDTDGILTFSMEVSEHDMAGAPAPNMSADEFASLIYVEAVSYQYIWLDHPDKVEHPDGYIGSVREDLDSWLDIDRYLGNDDGYVSLYELCGASPIPYGDNATDPLEANLGGSSDNGAEITYFIEFQLGGSLAGSVAGGAILTDVDYASQGDGVDVTITALLEGISASDTEVSSGNVFQAAGIAGPVLNVDTDVSYSAIQAAINDVATLAGHTITVAAGTYNEDVVINKSLTLEGANAGVSATETRGPESVIDAQLADFGVFIIEATTTATLDGFTVRNYEVAGVLAGSFGELEADPSAAHILNNVVEPPSLLKDVHNNNIQVGDGTTGTVIGNEVSGALLVDESWSGSGILVAGSSDVLVSYNYVHDCEGGIQVVGYLEYRDAPAENNAIEHNLVEDNETGISIQMHSTGSTIQYNDVLNNDEGIAVMAIDYSWPEHSTPSGTQIHLNNIVGNVESVVSGLWGSDTGNVLAEEVDATNNWWGHSSGPTEGTVQGPVDVNPWLLTFDLEGDTYDKTLALKDGWTLLSVDKAVSGPAWEGEALAYKYTPTSGFVDAYLADLQPLTAIFVKTVGGGGVGFNYLEGAPAIDSKNLEAGWNLIGSPGSISADALLAQLRYVTVGTQQIVGLTSLVAPGEYNVHGTDFDVPTLTDNHWNNLPSLDPFDGYWASMEAAEAFEVPH